MQDLSGPLLFALTLTNFVSVAIESPTILLKVPGVGRLRGLQKSSVNLFAGIRFAEAPIGDLRWKPPSPAKVVSKGEIDATTFGPACPQVVGSGEVIGDEDCLTLNVFTPSSTNHSIERLPVLVWIHGGSFVKGSANIGLNNTWAPMYDGRALAARGSIVVTVQYRLGALGFLADAALRSRDVAGSSGNYGIQDQRMALQWVQNNIGSFGGDPNRVLIFGQSAGAASVNWHLAADASRGLFATAALQSGACAPWGSQAWHDAEESYKAFLAELHCTDVPCLLAKSARALARATDAVGAQGLAWSPTVDGVEMKDFPCSKMERGEYSKVPVIIGFTRDESGPSKSGTTTEADFDAALKDVPHSLRSEIKASYAAQYSEWYWATKHFSADVSVSCPARRFVRAAVSSGSPVYAYKFSKQPSFPVELLYGKGIPERQMWGAYHGSELPFVFANQMIEAWHAKLTKVEEKVASGVSAHWLALSKSGRASEGWPLATSGSPESRRWLLLDSLGVSISEAQLFPLCSMLETMGHSKKPSLSNLLV